MPTKKKGQRCAPAAKAGKPPRRRDVAREAGAQKSKAGTARSSTALALAPSAVSVTPAEHAIIAENREREGRRPAPPVKVATVEGRHQLTINHQNAWAGSILLMNALGTTSWNFLEGLLKQLIPLCHYGEEISETALNSMLAAIKGIAPRDETEAMLAAQMVAIHSATMTAAGQLMYARGPEQDLVCTRLNKFARTYAAQVEAFKKYRSGGEQTIKVQHVTVNDGGQAIVGNVAPRGSGAIAKPEVQPHALTHAPGAAMRSPNATGELLPGPSHGERPLPDARRQVNGSAQGQPEQVEARALHCESGRDAAGGSDPHARDAHAASACGGALGSGGQATAASATGSVVKLDPEKVGEAYALRVGGWSYWDIAEVAGSGYSDSPEHGDRGHSQHAGKF